MSSAHIFLLLQVQQIGSSVIAKLADQGICLGLLAISTSILWYKNNALQRQFNQYLKNDRKEMTAALIDYAEVTRVHNNLMERMLMKKLNDN